MSAFLFARRRRSNVPQNLVASLPRGLKAGKAREALLAAHPRLEAIIETGVGYSLMHTESRDSHPCLGDALCGWHHGAADARRSHGQAQRCSVRPAGYGEGLEGGRGVLASRVSREGCAIQGGKRLGSIRERRDLSVDHQSALCADRILQNQPLKRPKPRRIPFLRAPLSSPSSSPLVSSLRRLRMWRDHPLHHLPASRGCKAPPTERHYADLEVVEEDGPFCGVQSLRILCRSYRL